MQEKVLHRKSSMGPFIYYNTISIFCTTFIFSKLWCYYHHVAYDSLMSLFSFAYWSKPSLNFENN